MLIYYPTYYLVPVVSVMSLDEDEYNARNNDECSRMDDYEYRVNYNMEANEVYNTYRDINEDIFEEIDKEYVNESTK
jgi:hypothetical protein